MSFANSVLNTSYISLQPLTESWSETLNIHYKLLFSTLLVFKIICVCRDLFLAVIIIYNLTSMRKHFFVLK